MKKIIFLLLLPIFSFAQQKDTINNATITVKNGNTTTVYNDVTIIIPKQSVSGGITKFQLDSGLSKKQDKLIQGANISIANNVISASGGGLRKIPDTTILPEQTWEQVIKFTTSGITYQPDSSVMSYVSRNGYRTNNGVNLPFSSRPDVVWTDWKYNAALPNGDRFFKKEPSFEETLEFYYKNPGFNPQFERHTRVYTTRGNEIRVQSDYVDVVNGKGRIDFTTSTITLNEPQDDGTQPKTVEIGNSSINLNRIAGQNAEMNLWSLFKFSGTGGVPTLEIKKDGFGGQGLYYGYGTFIMRLPTTATQSSQWYVDANGFVKMKL